MRFTSGRISIERRGVPAEFDLKDRVSSMLDSILTTEEAAAHLGIRVTTFYDWLSQSDAGKFVIRSQPVTIDYFQGGRKGQGRIRIRAEEARRLLELMRVQPQPQQKRKSPRRKQTMRHITATPGRPED